MYLPQTLNVGLMATIWPWLFPVTYLVHIAEEYWGGDGYSAHLANTRGVKLPPTNFLVLTGLGGVLMIVGIMLAAQFKFPQLLLVIFGALVLANGLSHTISGVSTAKYNPGLISGVLLWIPLGAITLLRLKGSMSGHRFFTALVIGVAIQVVVSLLSVSVEKLFRT
jgi:Protein of unknown function with HXXEE motif